MCTIQFTMKSWSYVNVQVYIDENETRARTLTYTLNGNNISHEKYSWTYDGMNNGWLKTYNRNENTESTLWMQSTLYEIVTSPIDMQAQAHTCTQTILLHKRLCMLLLFILRERWACGLSFSKQLCLWPNREREKEKFSIYFGCTKISMSKIIAHKNHQTNWQNEIFENDLVAFELIQLNCVLHPQMGRWFFALWMRFEREKIISIWNVHAEEALNKETAIATDKAHFIFFLAFYSSFQWVCAVCLWLVMVQIIITNAFVQTGNTSLEYLCASCVHVYALYVTCIKRKKKYYVRTFPPQSLFLFQFSAFIFPFPDCVLYVNMR